MRNNLHDQIAASRDEIDNCFLYAVHETLINYIKE